MVTHLLLLLLIVVIVGGEVKVIVRRRQGYGPARSRAGLPLVRMGFVASPDVGRTYVLRRAA
jgi:hypothetical protein